jgi:hypothetical protein
VGSAISDATRILGVAVIGSLYASLYAGSLNSGLGVHLPGAAADGSVGGALGAADQLAATGQGGLAAALHDAASGAFFHGFEIACLIAAAVAIAGAVMAIALLPAQPPRPVEAAIEAR